MEWFSRISGVGDFAVRLEVADLPAVVEDAEADAVALARGGVEQRHVGGLDRHFLLDDAARLALDRIGTGVALDAVDALDHDLARVEDLQDRAALALVLAGVDDHLVALADLFHQWPPTALPARARRSS